MRTFSYPLNHRRDEAYMARMCHEGWAATRLVEGVWTFEPCRPDQYVYRVCYLRGKSGAEVEELKRALAAKGIEFVSRYSFWAIFRSAHDFQLYAPDEELALCARIRRPMIAGGALSGLAFGALALAAGRISAWFYLPGALVGLYALMCTALGISYTGLMRRLRREQQP